MVDDEIREIRERVIRIEEKLDSFKIQVNEYKNSLHGLEGRVWSALLLALSAVVGAILGIIAR